MLKALIVILIVGFIGFNLLESATAKIESAHEKRETILNDIK